MTTIPHQLFRVALGRSHPLTAGSVRLEGPRSTITVRRDRYSIPHIEALTDEDAWFGLGFCEAQDRAFQLELRLRTVRGTLSALAGADTLALDRLSRRLGFIQVARKQLEVLDDDVRAIGEAFARGVNAGLTVGCGGTAPEFRLLRSRPSLWRAEDVVGIGNLMSFLLVGNWDVELARLSILRADGEQALRDLDPGYSEQAAAPQPDGLDRLADDLRRFVEFAGQSVGSNGWAVSGARTASGKPILANDPHLDAAIPPHWYLAHLRTPRWAVAGAALIGTPAIGSGHNGFCAWGITAGLADTVDLFVEEPSADGRSVRRGDGYEPCEVRREVIEVRRGRPVVEEVVDTPRGPIIGPVLRGEFGAVSMRASWMAPRRSRGFVGLPTVRSWEEFRGQFADWPLLCSNIVYADVEGHVAWQLVGEVPRRTKGWGTLPASGADPEAGWQEQPVPFAAMPYQLDPAQGFVASANGRPPVPSREHLGFDWLDRYRAARIEEALSERRDWDVASTARLQLDETTPVWRELRDTLLAVEPASALGREALALLRDWDGVVSEHSVAATVFEAVCSEMWRRIAKARAPRSFETALGRGFTDLLSLNTFGTARQSAALRHLVEQPDGWFERGWAAELADGFEAAAQAILARSGATALRRPANAWGTLRPLILRHSIGRIRQLAPLFNRGPFPWGGDSNTVSQAGTTPLRFAGSPLAVASLRVVVPLGDWEAARFVLPGGQSGDPFSPHYDDMLPLWRRGEGVPIAWSEASVRAATVSTLELRPLGRSPRLASTGV